FAEPGDLALQPRHPVEQVLAALEERLARGGQLQRAHRPVEQRHAHLLLELPDPLARGRLRDPVQLRPFGEAPHRGHVTKQAKGLHGGEMIPLETFMSRLNNISLTYLNPPSA